MSESGGIFVKYVNRLFAISVVLFAGFIIWMYICDSKQPAINDDLVKCDNDWYIKSNGENEGIDLPCDVDCKANQEVLISRIIKEEKNNCYCYAFYAVHQSIVATVDGEVIYKFTSENQTIGQSPGNGWHMIEVDSEDVGKELVISFSSPYNDYAGDIPTIYLASKYQVVMHVIRHNYINLIVSLLIGFVGVFICVCYFILKNKVKRVKHIMYLGIFAITISLWTLKETQIPMIIFGHYNAFSQGAILVMPILFYIFVYFLMYSYEIENVFMLNSLLCIDVALMMTQLVLQLLNICDSRVLLPLFHLLFVLGIIVFLPISISIILGKQSGNKNNVKINTICLAGLMCTFLVDYLMFMFVHVEDAAKTLRVGLLIYICVLSYLSLKESLNLIGRGLKTEYITELAYTDNLTKLKNRTAYNEDIGKIGKKDYEKYSIVNFDLNNLKAVNDNYGHQKGDMYIIDSGELINKVFGQFGRVYRIGGDEFCAILLDCDVEKFNELSGRLNAETKGYNSSKYKGKMQIAKGYAKYEAGIDRDLYDTISRADKYMYIDKSNLKKKRQNK